MSPGKSDWPIPEGWCLEVVYKPIRNIWFRANARTRVFAVSAPVKTSRETLGRAIRSKADWMASRAACPASPALIPSELKNGDTCFFQGELYAVSVRKGCLKNRVAFEPDAGIELQVRGEADSQVCARVLSVWYRQMLDQAIRGLLETWQPRLGVQVKECRIRKMISRWGSCNIRAKRVWINESLICLSPDLLAYVLVHELLHLIEPSHNHRFYRLMAGFVPDWREKKARLSAHAPGLS